MAAKAIIVAALLVAAPAVSAPAAATPVGAVPVTCGMTVTTDAYLAHDLTCATQTGVTLQGAVTFDLRGHRLTGPGRTTSSVAVSVSGSGGARIVAGEIKSWSAGVRADTGFGSVAISKIRFVGEDVGVNATATSVTVVDSRFSGVRSGVSGSFAPVTISRSVLWGDGAGIGVSDEQGSQDVDRSVIGNFGQGVRCDDGTASVTHSALVGNRSGVVNFLCLPTLQDDRLHGNEVGIDGGGLNWSVQASHLIVTGNRTGVLVGVGGAASVSDSLFAGNGVGVSVPVGGDNIFYPFLSLKHNVFRHNGDGVLVADPTTQSELGGNQAYRNARWGLYVAGTVNDLGGNVAYGNGEPAQCYGVVCAPRQ